MPDFNFVGAAYTAQSLTQDAQDLVNMYPQIDAYLNTKSVVADADRQVMALYPRAGLTTLATPGPSAQVRGLRQLRTHLPDGRHRHRSRHKSRPG